MTLTDDPILSELILSYNHSLCGLQTRPLPHIITATKLNIVDGTLRLELNALEEDEAFKLEPDPGSFLFYILSDIKRAESLLTWRMESARTLFNLAVLVVAPWTDFGPLTAILKEQEHRVAGWLDIPEEKGLSNVMALFVLGANADEI